MVRWLLGFGLLLSGCDSEVDIRGDLETLRDDVKQTQVDREKAAVTEKTMREMDAVLRTYRAANKRVADNLQQAYDHGRRVPKDGWGNAFRYEKPGPKLHKWDVISLGADGKVDGEGLNADIRLSNLK